MSSQATRRDLLGEGLRLGGLAVASAGVPALLGAGEALAQGEGDVETLAGLARLEMAAVITYQRAQTSREFSPRLRDLAELLHDQDRDHADQMIHGLETLGVRQPAKPATVGDVEGLAEALAGGDRAVLEFAVALEERTVGAYYRAQRTLQDAKLLQIAATIMGSDGQHLVVLRRMLHRNPVPHALETGSA